MSETMTDNAKIQIEPIAHIYTGFSEKFGIPRQSGLVKELEGKIVFERNTEMRKRYAALRSFLTFG